MADNKNMELNDKAMEQATGGMMDDNMDTATITTVLTVNPNPEDPDFTGLWEECVNNGYRVYQIGKSGYAIAGPHLPEFFVGDVVALNHIRGFWGLEIEGVFDGPVIL